MNASFYQLVPLPLGLTLPVSLGTFFLPVALALAWSVEQYCWHSTLFLLLCVRVERFM